MSSSVEQGCDKARGIAWNWSCFIDGDHELSVRGSKMMGSMN